MGVFAGVYGANPGSTLSLTRDAATGLVGARGDVAGAPARDEPPLQRSLPGDAELPDRGRGRIAPTTSGPSRPTSRWRRRARWTVSFQRSLTKDMAVDIRYVGTRGVNQWSTIDYNERQHLIENGFVDEFRLAMANLQANNARRRRPRRLVRLLRSGHAARSRCRSTWRT